MTNRYSIDPTEVMNIRRNGKMYQSWLSALVNGEQYQILLDILHNIEFTWSVPFDENRAEDGIGLRYRFQTEHGLEYLDASDDYPCSVLEMLIGLAVGIEDAIMYDAQSGDRTVQWFWMMLCNLGVVYQDSDLMGRLNSSVRLQDEIVVRITCFMERKYDRNGNGGLFPLRNAVMDQRRVELWYQANEYAYSVLL